MRRMHPLPQTKLTSRLTVLLGHHSLAWVTRPLGRSIGFDRPCDAMTSKNRAVLIVVVVLSQVSCSFDHDECYSPVHPIPAGHSEAPPETKAAWTWFVQRPQSKATVAARERRTVMMVFVVRKQKHARETDKRKWNEFNESIHNKER